MRIIHCFFLLCAIGVAHCSVLTQVPTAITTSQRIGGSFAYSTIESAPVPLVHNTLPVTYASAPLTIAQPLYTHQSIFGSPFLNPIISSPFYPGFIGQAPVIGQNPIVGQHPVVGQLPGQGQGPVQAPVAPAPPQGIPQGPVQPPPGATVDDDTVSVESA